MSWMRAYANRGFLIFPVTVTIPLSIIWLSGSYPNPGSDSMTGTGKK